MKKSALLVTGLATLLAGCADDIEVSINFSQPQAVESGDPVVFNDQTIGSVDVVDNNDEQTRITVELDEDLLAGLSTKSAAMLVEQPQRRIELYSNNTTGEPLQSGAEIIGLNNSIELATWTAGNALGSLQGWATSAAEAFNDFLNQSNWDQLSEQMNETLSGLGEESADALNQLGGDLELFIKNMQEQSSQSLKQADELSKQLNEELQKFQQQGAEDMAKALQNMLDAFNSTVDPDAVPFTKDKGEPL